MVSDSQLAATRATTKVGLATSVEEMWPAFKNAVSLIAQHCPQFIHSCQLLHGDGGPGSIRLVKFGPASGLVTYAKEEIVEVDEEKMVLTYLLLEGDLKKQFKVFKPSISLERVAEANEPKAVSQKVDTSVERNEPRDLSEGQHQSIATWTLEYEVEEGMPPPQIELLNEGAKIFFKLLEASVKVLQAPANTPTTPHSPIKEESPTPLVA
ncbi:hypothetical protein GOP47_0017473 [Adiantum capillus-veneris]|uniref:Bet v I/Major latex protein domain-containing protein n=1 Tax=Adiantum capillus-veneris TaxID=13818 RepID=A0A9D4UFN8_ADICA|nr:hypothetical protein GOP47_0017473 [Adiantum capillus-veneris]